MADSTFQTISSPLSSKLPTSHHVVEVVTVIIYNKTEQKLFLYKFNNTEIQNNDKS